MSDHRSRRTVRPWVWLALALVTVGVVVFGCSSATDEPATPARVTAPPTITATLPPVPSPNGVRVSVPKLGVTSDLLPLGLTTQRTMEAPPLADPLALGWFQYSPLPGQRGPAILLGHVNANGRPGVFARLDTLVPGDRVDVARPGGGVRFTVYRVQRVEKERFPTAAVFGDVPGPELRLLTCGGDLDASGHNYRDNVIVFARVQG